MKLYLNRFSGLLVAFALVSAPPFLAAEKQAQPPPPQAPAPQAVPPQKTASAAPTQPEAPRAIIRLAEHDSKDHAAKKFIGHDLRGSDGRNLGKVKDFLLDPQTGRVDFAVVASGGIAGMGDKLRLVPVLALNRTGKKDEFAVNINEDQWKRLTTLADDEFKSGEVTVTDAQRREIAQNFESHASPASDSGVYAASLTSHLVRASELSGRTVRAGSSKLGEIDAIVLDLPAGTAQALVDPDKDFTGTRATLLVPFNQFTITSGKRPQVTTLLTRSDFQQLRPAGATATGIASATPSASPSPAAQPNASQSTAQPNASQSKAAPAVASSQPATGGQKTPAQPASTPSASAPSAPAASTQSAVATNESPAQAQPKTTAPAAPDPTTSSARVATTDKSPAAKNEKGENLSPTGKTSADAIPAGTDPLLLATARAIRKALDDDPALARADVRVTPEEGKIVLRGRVNDQKTKTAIIEKATSEVKGWKIDDQISLDNR